MQSLSSQESRLQEICHWVSNLRIGLGPVMHRENAGSGRASLAAVPVNGKNFQGLFYVPRNRLSDVMNDELDVLLLNCQ